MLVIRSMNLINQHFSAYLSYVMPLFQNKSSCKIFHMNVSLICMIVNLNDWFYARRLVLTQVKGNSVSMAY